MSNYYNRQWRLPNEENKSKVSNYSMDFDGSNDYISAGSGSGITGSNPFSMSAWFKLASAPSGYPMILSTGRANNTNENILYVSPSYKLGWGNSSVNADFPNSSGTTLSLNTWVHGVVTFNGSNTIKIYVNGSLDGSKTDVSGVNIEDIDIVIGARTNNGNTGKELYFNGQIDGVAIFDYALSSSQITTLYGSSSTGIGNPMSLNPKPVAYYPLGDQDSFNSSSYLVPNASLKDFVFDFSSDLIDSNFSLTTGQTQFSASIWVKFTGSLGNDESLIANESSYAGDGFAIFKNTSNKIVFKCESQSATGTTTIALNKWYLATATYNAGAMILYVNGQQEATQTTATSITQPSTPKTRLGKYITGNVIPFTGELSNAQIFNTALSATDVETLYNNGSPLTSMSGFTSLQGWWKLDASEIYDSSNTEWKINNAVSSYSNSLFVDNVFQSTSTNGITMGSYSDTAGLSAVSWSLWINLQVLNSASGYSRILNSDSFFFATNQSNGGQNWTFAFVTVNGTISKNFTLSTALQNQGWVNIIGTYDGTNTKFYLNTVQQGTQGSGSGVLNTTSSLNLGYNYGSNSVDAYFSNFSIWNKALSTSDISEIYNSGSPSNLSSHSSTSNLINWWKLNNLSTGLQDSKGSSNASINGTSSLTTVQSGSVSTLNGTSSGMTQANLVQSDLSFKSGYSPYALSFDGTNEKIEYTNGTIDLGLSSTETWWIKYSNSSAASSSIASAPVFAGFHILYEKSTNKVYYRIDSTNLYYEWEIPSTYFTDNLWHHYAIVRDDSLPFSSYIKLYIDGDLFGSPTAVNATSKSTTNTKITDWGGASAYSGIVAHLSNIAVWNISLSSTEITEIFNSGVPSNLNNFSGTKPYSWWQLGSNMSYNSNWTILDEGTGNNNGSAFNISENSIVDGVGSSANGLSSGMGGDEVIGDAPYSTANSLSVNMDVEDRTTDTPS